MKKYTKGFTLIELLVVIAIIGILSSVVLASLSTARGRAADAAVKANLSGIRAQAELLAEQYGCYTKNGTACSATTPAVASPQAVPATSAANIFGDPTVNSALVAADTAGGFVSVNATVGGGAWAAVGQYKSDPLKGWCVDSSGKSKEVTITTGTAQANVDAEIASGACVE
jgi:type IV pilus assembly protein PilA